MFYIGNNTVEANKKTEAIASVAQFYQLKFPTLTVRSWKIKPE